MKLNFGKKLVLFLHWLMSLIACAIVIAASSASIASRANILPLS